MEKKYRKAAGIVLFNQEGKVWMGARRDKDTPQWQFPHGGMEAGESPKETAVRELSEETGITDIKWITTLSEPIKYDFPSEIIENFKRLGRDNVGQASYWSLFYFCGSDNEIDFTTYPEEIEFKDYRWVDIEEAPKLVVDWKKEAYRQVVRAFKPLIEKYLSTQY